MKKFIATILIAALVVTGAFAVDMSLGAETGFGQYYRFVSDSSIKNSIVPINVDFLLSLEDTPVSFGFNLGTDINIYKGIDSKNETKAAFDLAAAAYYRYEASKKLDVLAGLGLRWDFVSLDSNKLSTTTNNSLSLYLDAEVRYEVAKNVEVFGGFEFGGAVLDKTTTKVERLDPVSVNNLEKISTLRWGLKAGAAYKF